MDREYVFIISYIRLEVTNIAKNDGKRFEDNWKSSCNKIDYLLTKRLNDNASAWSGGSKTRFASDNECDYILFDGKRRNFFALELKSTIHKSLTYWREDFEDKSKKQHFMIRKCQIKGLQKWNEYENTICGLIINFSQINNDTFFVDIGNFLNYTKDFDKKSINYSDVLAMNPIKIESEKLRTNYKYNVEKFLEEFSD